ncbi:MAG: hypothetical protein KC417_14270, partial [Myxococcales bacterium]|nr:hypothetical protein [Myxococcales bacterium]
ARGRQWSEADADMDRALSVLSDLSTSRRMTNEIEDLIDRLNAALGGANRVHAFADLRRDRERSVALRNQLAVIRAELLARESATTGNAELDKVRAERRQLEPLLKKMPRSDEDFEVRDQQLFARYREMSKELSALGVEVMGLEARLTALERYSADSKTPAATEALKAELEQHRAAAKSFRKDITEYVRLIELARLQVGVGDSRYQRDDRNRAQYLELIARERQLMASLGIRRDSGVDAGLERAARLDASLAQRDAAVDVIVEERISGMRSVIDEETEKLAGYRTSLDSLSGEAEEVVGGVTYANFESVRKRFYDLVLRADVGRIDIAWARREEHRMKVDTLTRARSSELQAIDGEFEEISDTGTSTEPEAAQ